ncbi:type 2 isopentenyl-diphosphate Delta-isomerase [Pueribacillus sp. YX66]|uniref:type 2 isopentenyl-diphosphate Delta-isomerase n=1 Tax=Pueribacillus sp. YX66 TaxID=3229242 RepID=UPI00358D0741
MREKRKHEHIDNALTTGQLRLHGFDDIQFVHQSLPETRLDEIEISTAIGELELSSPIFINAMTGGGGKRTKDINAALAEVANECKLAIGVGSQMAAIKDRSQEETYRIIRKKNPNGIVFANLGSEATSDDAQRAIEMIEADALQIHLNVVQELIMPEGDRDFHLSLSNIEKIASHINVPLIVKEVGFGISKETAKKLSDVGATIIDVSGFGGTNFSAIENMRRKRTLSFLNHWGIPTACSLAEVKKSLPTIEVIASGGIQTSLDVAKAISLGASACGLAGYILNILVNDGEEKLIEEIQNIHHEIKMIMTALGTPNIHRLQKAPIVISGPTHHWLKERGIKTETFSQR